MGKPTRWIANKLVGGVTKSEKMCKLFIKQLEDAKKKGIMPKKQADGWIAEIKKKLEMAKKDYQDASNN